MLVNTKRQRVPCGESQGEGTRDDTNGSVAVDPRGSNANERVDQMEIESLRSMVNVSK